MHTPCPSVNTRVAPTHPLATLTVHPPVDVLQHDPDPGHELGTQTPPCVHVLGDGQFAWITGAAHAPAALQHVPPGGCTHGFGEHTPWPSVNTPID